EMRFKFLPRSRELVGILDDEPVIGRWHLGTVIGPVPAFTVRGYLLQELSIAVKYINYWAIIVLEPRNIPCVVDSVAVRGEEPRVIGHEDALDHGSLTRGPLPVHVVDGHRVLPRCHVGEHAAVVHDRTVIQLEVVVRRAVPVDGDG